MSERKKINGGLAKGLKCPGLFLWSTKSCNFYCEGPN